MKAYRFDGLLQHDGWIKNAIVNVNENGIITSIVPEGSGEAEMVRGFAVPGFQNAHSHAFQYAMAGIAENHENGAADDFWSWREAMYKLALAVDPEDLEHIAAMVYAEMVRHGYTHVAEFHYLHHDKSGKPYNNSAEHGERLIAAAQLAGIKITLVPVFYQQGGFGMAPQARQRRFILPNSEVYFKMLEASQRAVDQYDGARLGFGVHSLRAARPEDVQRIVSDGPADLPFHIHVAEQAKEVEEALAYLEAPPVQWLLENVAVNNRFHLVHATHIQQNEIEGIARSESHVVLCPSTEGNLGDGIFPLKIFQDHGGKWSIGTDSHIGLNPLEELRLLDYGQRLTSHQRNTFTGKYGMDSGLNGYEHALLAGRKAMGNNTADYLKEGQSLDVVVYDATAPLLATSSVKNLLSTILYGTDSNYTVGTMIDGEWKTLHNRHTGHQRIYKNYLKTMKRLELR